MGVETILGIGDVAETDDIQLLLASAACRIDREENGPGYKTAYEADGHRNLEVPEQEEAIKRVVIEDIAVRDLVESADPIEHAIGKVWRPLPSNSVSVMPLGMGGKGDYVLL